MASGAASEYALELLRSTHKRQAECEDALRVDDGVRARVEELLARHGHIEAVKALRDRGELYTLRMAVLLFDLERVRVERDAHELRVVQERFERGQENLMRLGTQLIAARGELDAKNARIAQLEACIPMVDAEVRRRIDKAQAVLDQNYRDTHDYMRKRHPDAQEEWERALERNRLALRCAI
jgi:hypothetical protein